MLGENVDNPKITFRAIEDLIEKRIENLSSRLFSFIKDSDKDSVVLEKLEDDIKNDIDNVDREYYYMIKQQCENLILQVDEYDAKNQLLQKQITSLIKEKNELLNRIKELNNRLDDIEKDLGINIAAKRAKKKI